MLTDWLFDSRVVFLAPYNGMIFLVALCAKHVEVRYPNFFRLEVVILLQTVIKFIVTFAV
jgi:hypothetical protein